MDEMLTELLCQRDEIQNLKEALRFTEQLLCLAIAGLMVMTVGFLWAVSL